MVEQWTSKRALAWGCQLALIALLLSPGFVWWYKDHGPLLPLQAVFAPIVLLLLLYALLGRTIWIASLLLTPFVILAPLEAFYIHRYGHPTSAEVIATIFATNQREMREFLSSDLLPLTASILVSTSVSLTATWCSWKTSIRWRGRMHAWVLAVGVLTPVMAIATSVAVAQGSLGQRLSSARDLWSTFLITTESGYPFGLIQRLLSYRQQWEAMRAGASRLDNFRFHSHRVMPASTRQVYVLVIGESSRRDHWQLFGYARETSPELTHTSNIIAVPDMVTSWPTTVMAVPLVLTRKPITSTQLSFNEASIVRAMQEAGFETHWISNQLATGQFDSPVAVFAYEAQQVHWLNHATWGSPGSYDENLVASLHAALTSSNKDTFVVLHMMGSHTGYDFRYPEEFKRFTPISTDLDNQTPFRQRLVNSYDNSILYTDHVMASIIRELRNTGAIAALWFESDHGEMLPTDTCDLRGHGFGTDAELKIPAFFWYSDTYGEAFPDRLARIRENAHKPVLSADTFESLIDMAGINFTGHDETRSLFSSRWKYRPRIVHSYWQADFDHATRGKRCPIVMEQAP